MSLLHRFVAHEGGNVLITTALAFPLALSAAGVAISYSSATAIRTKLQTSLDAAVLAGAGMADNTPLSDQLALADKVFRENLDNFVATSTNGATASFKVEAQTLLGDASATVKNPFGHFIGSEDTVTKVAAAATKQKLPVCVLGLNGFDQGSFDINGTKAQFLAPNCAVQANSTSRSGMTQEGNPTAKARKFGVTGGHKGNNFSPPPVDGSPKIPDPYASKPFPSSDECGIGKLGLQVKDSITLSPGTYCGGVHVSGTDIKVTLQPGIYVMKDGPFWSSSSPTIIGENVMIAFTGKGATLQTSGSSSLKLTSPTSGPYMNMQFMQDRSSGSTAQLWVSIGGNSNVDYDGVAYFPTQNFWVFGDAVLKANSPSLVIVADKIWTQGSAKVTVTNENKRSLSASAVTTNFGVTLVR